MSLLRDKLNELQKEDWYPFHMPGHKRRPVDAKFAQAYSMDVTEIPGFDDLHHAQGVIADEQRYVAEQFGSAHTFFLVGGSSCGILSALMLYEKKPVLVARNSHKSAYHGLMLADIRADYIYPEILEGYDFYTGITSAQVARAIAEKEATGDAYEAIFITSPTYEGMVSDIARICQVAHGKGIQVIVDEAHGAHLSLLSGRPASATGQHVDGATEESAARTGRIRELDDASLGVSGKNEDGIVFPKSAVDSGADIVIQSVHKTLPCMTQTALLHVNGTLVDVDKLKFYLQVFQSSSPSYVLMDSIATGVHYVAEHGETLWEAYSKRLSHFYKKMESLKVLYLVPQMPEKDPGKLIIVVPDGKEISAASSTDEVIAKADLAVDAEEECANTAHVTGIALADILREKYHLQLEMATESYALAMTSIMDTEEGFGRLADALLEIDAELQAVIAGRESHGHPHKEKADEGCVFYRKKENIKNNLHHIVKTQDIEKKACDVPSHTVAIMISANATRSPVVHGYTIKEALLKNGEYIEAAKAAGQVSQEFLYLYPPGVPLLVPGEVITEEMLSYIKNAQAAGQSVQGPAKWSEEQLRVMLDT